MPATSSRISTSSSTTRMSAAIRKPCPRILNLYAAGALRRGLLALPLGREAQDHLGPRPFGRVLHDQQPAMLLHAPLDDGQAEARALLAGRDLRLGQAVAVLGGQADAVVLDLERHLLVVDHQPGPEAALQAGSAAW